MCKPEEALEFLYRCGFGPVEHRLHLTVVHGDTLRVDDIAQERDLCLVELTLLYFSIQLVLDESFKYCSDVLQMGIKGVRIYQYIIDVDNDELAEHVPEDIVDEHLEHRRTVGKPEGHNPVFIVPRCC